MAGAAINAAPFLSSAESRTGKKRSPKSGLQDGISLRNEIMTEMRRLVVLLVKNLARLVLRRNAPDNTYTRYRP